MRDQPSVFLFLQLHLKAHRRPLVEHCRALADHYAHHPGIGCRLLGASDVQPKHGTETLTGAKVYQRGARWQIVRERVGVRTLREPRNTAQLIHGRLFADKSFDEIFSAALRCARPEIAGADHNAAQQPDQ